MSGLRVEIPEEFTRNYLGVISDKSFGQSVPIKLAEVRRSEMWGASFAANNNYIVQMFSPQDIRDALVLAREWTDRWFAYNPEARERAILRRAEAPGLAHVQSMRA